MERACASSLGAFSAPLHPQMTPLYLLRITPKIYRVFTKAELSRARCGVPEPLRFQQPPPSAGAGSPPRDMSLSRPLPVSSPKWPLFPVTLSQKASEKDELLTLGWVACRSSLWLSPVEWQKIMAQQQPGFFVDNRC